MLTSRYLAKVLLAHPILCGSESRTLRRRFVNQSTGPVKLRNCGVLILWQLRLDLPGPAAVSCARGCTKRFMARALVKLSWLAMLTLPSTELRKVSRD